MKINNFLLIAFISIIIPRILYAGTAHYVDCSRPTNGNGTYGSPWNNIPSVNSHSFSTGDDVYFKVGTTCTLTANGDRLKVHWGGTSGDRAIIGAYYGNGQFGLNGNPRPIIDGGNGSFPSAYQGLVEVYDATLSHITIKDLTLQNSEDGLGVYVWLADNINVENCYLYRVRTCIMYAGNYAANDGVDTGVISDNECAYAGYPTYPHGGAAIEITGMGRPGVTTNITVTRNYMHNGTYEGIGFYKGVTNCVAEYNVVRDMLAFYLYFGQAKYCKFRYNLVYESTDKAHAKFTELEFAIASDVEAWQDYVYNGDNEIYGNFVAGTNRAINFGCEIALCTDVGVPYERCKGNFSNVNCQGNTKVYNNTLVDNNWNFMFWDSDSRDNIEIKNNISWTISTGAVHSNNYSPAGVTWSHNLFDEAVTGNAATNAVIGDPALEKSLGWRLLTANSLDGSEFIPTATSDAIDAGVSITGYDDRITNADYTAHPISVTTGLDGTPDIGAFKYNNGGDIIPPAKPTGLVIIE